MHFYDPPTHLLESMPYIRDIITSHPSLHQALLNNNLDLILPYRGKLYRVTYSGNVKQITPFPSKETKSTQTDPIAQTIKISSVFTMAKPSTSQQASSKKVEGKSPAATEVIDIDTPPRTAAEIQATDTITLS